MSGAKSSFLVTLLILFVALNRIIIATAVLPFETEDLNVKQWTTISSQFKTWTGFWVRYDTSAKPILTSMVMRNFTYLNHSTVLHSTVFRNPKVRAAGFFPSGIYTESTFNNPMSRSSSLYFYPVNWGVARSHRLVAKSSAVEKFFIHDANAMVSCMPIYDDGRLSQVTIFRERRHPGSVTSLEALRVKTRSLRGNGYVLAGVWTRVQECIDKDYRYSKGSGLLRDFQVPLTTSHERYAYEFAWGVSISVPNIVGAQDPFSAYFM